MIDSINKKTVILERAVDAAWMRNETISNNIANVNTPGYKKSYVRFEELLTSAAHEFQIAGLKKDSRFLPIGTDTGFNARPEIVKEEFTSMRRDGNNVDVDVEMAELAKNSIKYNALIAQMSKEFSIIRVAINGGR